MSDSDIDDMQHQLMLLRINKGNMAIVMAQSVLGISLEDIEELLTEIERLRALLPGQAAEVTG